MITVNAIFSDPHVGSRVALAAKEGFPLSDGGTYYPTKLQKWINAHWEKYWLEVKKLKEKYNAELYAISNGDFFDNDHHGTYQIHSCDPSDMIKGGLSVAQHILNCEPDYMVFIKGTEVHAGKSGWMEEELASRFHDRLITRLEKKYGQEKVRELELGVIGNKETNEFSHWCWKGEIDYLKYLVFHHGRIGTMPHTYANSFLSSSTFVAQDNPDVDIILTAHRHFPVDSHELIKVNYQGETKVIRAFMTAGWQGKTGFVERAAGGRKAFPIGGMIIISDGKKYKVLKRYVYPKPNPTWKKPK